MYKVVAVVVTYNRKELLEECLNALLNQSIFLDKILVVNNCSTDGTEKMFEPGSKFYQSNIELYTTSKNLGGAGGFCEGIKKADQMDCDFMWIMDDDTIPNENALKGLLKSFEYLKNKGESKISFLASMVFGPNNEPMNVPVIQNKVTSNGYSDWYKHLDRNMIKIKSATFVSLLISHSAVKQVGYPISEYFIWGDDTEYTQRLVSRYGDAYFCGESIVLHKRFNAKNISIFNENNPNRIKMYSYFYRNSLLNAKKYNSKINVLYHIVEYYYVSLKCLFGKNMSFRFNKFCAVQKGILDFFKSKL